MCPTPDETNANGKEEMVAIDTQQPSLPPPQQTQPNGKAENGHSHPPAVKSHKGVYGRASDFLSNTSNWKVGHLHREEEGRGEKRKFADQGLIG